MAMISDIIFEMITVNANDTKRINHALKVYGFAKCIAGKEHISNDEMQIVEISALLHDIAIRYCEKTYGSCGGKLQEQEGPKIAQPILEKYAKDKKIIERILYIIAHHHTYDNIDGIDFQIIIEADFLVNAQEGDISEKAFKRAYQKFFKTKTGKEIADTIVEGL